MAKFRRRHHRRWTVCNPLPKSWLPAGLLHCEEDEHDINEMMIPELLMITNEGKVPTFRRVT